MATPAPEGTPRTPSGRVSKRRRVEPPTLDLHLLYDDLDAKRRHYGLSWHQLALILNCYSSSLQRMRHTRSVSGVVLASILTWLDKSPAWYLNDPVPHPRDGQGGQPPKRLKGQVRW